jgi:dimethylhistidine N-methyltransferase
MLEEVLAGLRAKPKRLSPTWFYDELGSFLFDAICDTPEYYVTRVELDIMREFGPDIARCIGANAALIEYGSGASLKTRLLLDCLDTPAVYMPVDIARGHLLDAAGALARDYPALRIQPLCQDFTKLFSLPKTVESAERRVIYFPGATIGNFEPEKACALLTGMRSLIGKDGALLIGVDLRKDPWTLERAYNDSGGVTAEFNLNALRHVNRELGTNFALDSFEHRACWVEAESRVEMNLVSLRKQRVHVGNEQIEFQAGEPLRTECCHKYTIDGFAGLAAHAGLVVQDVWLDEEEQFSVQWLSPRTLQ